MEILNIIRGTAIHFQMMETPVELFITDLVEELRRRYRFFEAPCKADEIDPEKGLRFALGRFEGATIDSLEVFNSALVVRGPAATEILDRFLEDISNWATETLHVTIAPSQPVARAYNSTLEVSASFDLLRWHKRLDAFREMLGEMVSRQGFDVAPYEAIGMAMHTEKERAVPLQPAKFTLERRVGHHYGENIFFSEAPVATADHKKLLDSLETLL